MRYFRPKTITWWTGALCIALGILQIVCKTCELGEFGAVLAMLGGSSDTSPAGLIFIGLGFIGIRDKLERMG